MERNILFSERQKFRQWWLWLILAGINGLFLFGVCKQVIGGAPFGDNPMSDTGLSITAGLTLLLAVLLINARLDTQVKKDGIYIKFFPFHASFRHYSWSMIAKAFVRAYDPVSEYGGWGLRLGLFGKGKAFTVSGNKGLQLEFSNNKKVLIGTNKPEELTAALTKLGQLNP